MSTLKHIFNIDFDTNSFIKLAELVLSDLPGSVVRKVRERETRIKAIADRIKNTKEYTPDTTDIDSLKRKFMEYKTEPNSNVSPLINHVYFSRKELKKLSYYVNLIAKIKSDYDSLIHLFSENWNNRLLTGLLYYLLSNWNTIEHDPSSESLRFFIRERLQNYEGKRRNLVSVKQNIYCIADGGAVEFGLYLKNHQIPILQATEILGMRDQSFTYSYFSKVIQTYFHKTGFSIDLEQALVKHENLETNKLIVSNIIVQIEKGHFTDHKERVKTFAVRSVGDPTVLAQWSTSGYDEVTQKTIQEARNILNRWMIEMYIEIIFDKIIVDRERRNFWMKYAKAKKIDYLKVIGSPFIRRILDSNANLKNSLSHYFKQTTNEYNKTTCAIMMKMGNRYFIEFSDLGALYIYKEGNQINSFLNRNIEKIEDMKTTKFNNLVEPSTYYEYYNEEGKMVHRGYWEDRLTRWINKKLEIYV